MKYILQAIFIAIAAVTISYPVKAQTPPPPWVSAFCSNPCPGAGEWADLPVIEHINSTSPPCTLYVKLQVRDCEDLGMFYRLADVTSNCPITESMMSTSMTAILTTYFVGILSSEPVGTTLNLITPKCYKTYTCSCELPGSAPYAVAFCGSGCCMRQLRKERKNCAWYVMPVDESLVQTEHSCAEPSATPCAGSGCSVMNLSEECILYPCIEEGT